jgi:hypothetical protein
MHGAFDILPRATRVCEELDCLDIVLKIARCLCVREREMCVCVCVRAASCTCVCVRGVCP